MNRNIVETFAATYPKNKVGGTIGDFDNLLLPGENSFSPRGVSNSSPSSMNKTPNPGVKNAPVYQRTPLNEVMVETFNGGNMKQSSGSTKQCDSKNSGMKKFFVILFIVFIGAFIYSSIAYTLSDSMFSKFGFQFFESGGNPSSAIIAIHSVVFLILVYLIMNVFSWC